MKEKQSQKTLRAVRRQMKTPVQMDLRVTYARGSPFIDADPAQYLQKLRQEILKRVRVNIRQSAFSLAAKKRLSRAIKVKMRPKSMLFFSLDPVWGYLVGGRHKRQMKWLKKAARPIPIVTEKGEVIYRTATARSMKDGRWVFPRREPVDLFTSAVKESREVLRARLAKLLAVQLRRG